MNSYGGPFMFQKIAKRDKTLAKTGSLEMKGQNLDRSFRHFSVELSKSDFGLLRIALTSQETSGSGLFQPIFPRWTCTRRCCLMFVGSAKNLALLYVYITNKKQFASSEPVSATTLLRAAVFTLGPDCLNA